MADRNIEALVDPLYIGNGANRVKVGTDGTLTVEEEGTTWDDLRASLIGQKLYSNRGTVDYNYSEGAVSFSPNGDITNDDDYVLVNYQMPHAALVDGPFHFHMHWFQTDNTPREITLEYRVQSNGEPKDTTWTQIVAPTGGTADAFTYTSGTLNQITELFTLDTTGFGISAVIQVRMTRSDSVAGAIDITQLDAHYKIDSFGSSEEYIK